MPAVTWSKAGAAVDDERDERDERRNCRGVSDEAAEKSESIEVEAQRFAEDAAAPAWLECSEASEGGDMVRVGVVSGGVCIKRVR